MTGLVSCLFILAQTFITLDQALEIALSENVAVKVADKEIERSEYAKRGTYASLFPKIDGSAAFQRTIEKQVMYMDFDMSSIMGGGTGSGSGTGTGTGSEGTGSGSGTGSTGSGSGSGMSKADGMEVGRWNTFSAGVTASMPIVNLQLWESMKISGQDVELAVEKARSSRLDMVSQVKNAFYAVLLAKQAHEVYKDVYDNAVANYERTQMKYEAQKASDLDLARAATTLANAVPNMYDSANSIALALWQLKAVMGVDLEEDIDVAGSLYDYADDMTALYAEQELDLENNTTMKQLSIQAEQLASNIKMQKYSALPTLALSFSYNYSAMANDFEFSQYKWTPYSYVALSLNIPIFAGGKRYNTIKAAQVQSDELALQKKDTERQLKIALKKSVNTMATALRSFDAADKALEAAQKAYDITEESYAVGSSTLTDLNDAQLALVQSKMTAAQSIYSYLTAKTSLEQTLGMDYTTEENNE